MGFLTATSICCTSFLVGILATSLLWDSTILFGVGGPVNEQTVRTVEAYYLTWWNGARVVKTLLHVMILVDYGALIFKFARKADEAAFWFSGGSLLSLVMATSCYITITVPYVRNIAYNPIDQSKRAQENETDLFSTLQGYITRTNTGVIGRHAREVAGKVATDSQELSFQQRLEHDAVLSAANTIILFFLVGIIVLQLGEWYVVEDMKASQAPSAVPVVTEEKKKQ